MISGQHGPSTGSIYRERGFGGRQGAGTNPVLLVIDMNNAFTDPDSPLCCDPDGQAVRAIRMLLDAARTGGSPVVFTTVIYDQATARIVGPLASKVPVSSLRPGTREVEIDSRIAPASDELLLTKLFPSGFAGTPLQQALVAYRCDTVVVTGASTSGCVRATALDALQHGYRVVVPREAVADRAAGPHDASLFDIDQKIGDVVDLVEAARLLARPTEQQ